MAIYLVECETIRVNGRNHLKEICSIPLLQSRRHLVQHEMIKMPHGITRVQQLTSKDRATYNYVYSHHHKLPLSTHYDVPASTNSFPSGSLLVTHGREKAHILQLYYPETLVVSLLDDISLNPMVDILSKQHFKCPLLPNHGPHCSYLKLHILLLLLCITNI